MNPTAKIEKILVALDFSEASVAAVEYAVETGAALGASVSLLHVYSLPVYPVLPGGESFVPGPGLVADQLQRAHEEMKGLVALYQIAGVKLDARSVEGPVAETIVRVAREDGYDLIVMGTHGRTGLDRILVGSIAERVVRTSPTPVLTVRDPERAAPPVITVPVF